MNEIFAVSVKMPMFDDPVVFSLAEGGDGDLFVCYEGIGVRLPPQVWPQLVAELQRRQGANATPEAEPKGQPSDAWYCGNGHLREEWIARLVTAHPAIAAGAGWSEALESVAYTAGPGLISELSNQLQGERCPF